AVHGGFGVVHALGGQGGLQFGKQAVEGGATGDGHVVDLVHGVGVLGSGGQQVGLHGVFNKAEVPAGFAGAVDEDVVAPDHGGRPLGDDSGIGTIGVLPGAKNVEVAQADGVKAVAAGKHVGIQLVHIFGDGVGAERFANGVFDLGQAGVVAI